MATSLKIAALLVLAPSALCSDDGRALSPPMVSLFAFASKILAALPSGLAALESVPGRDRPADHGDANQNACRSEPLGRRQTNLAG